jgi:pimeloyl-ACP methyl ester carboxylesterase
MAPSNPVLIFMPGAWHSPDCFAKVTGPLSEAGYTIKLVHSALFDPPPDAIPDTYHPDVEQIQTQIRVAILEGKKVVLFGHSFGGLALSAAVEGFEEHITGMILCAAWLIPKGKAPADLGGPAPWHKFNDEHTLVEPIDPRYRFYHDLTEEEANVAIARLKPHACRAGATVTPFEGFRAVPTTYIMCTQDRAIPLEMQEKMVDVFAKDSGIKTIQLDSSHSPFMSVPDRVVEIIEAVASNR